MLRFTMEIEGRQYGSTPVLPTKKQHTVRIIITVQLYSITVVYVFAVTLYAHLAAYLRNTSTA